MQTMNKTFFKSHFFRKKHGHPQKTDRDRPDLDLTHKDLPASFIL